MPQDLAEALAQVSVRPARRIVGAWGLSLWTLKVERAAPHPSEVGSFQDVDVYAFAERKVSHVNSKETVRSESDLC